MTKPEFDRFVGEPMIDMVATCGLLAIRLAEVTEQLAKLVTPEVIEEVCKKNEALFGLGNAAVLDARARCEEALKTTGFMQD